MQQYQDLLIDALLDQGFSLEEAERLIALQDYAERAFRQARVQGEYQHWAVDNQKPPACQQ
jgi:DNA-binding transcriptional MerR regulator